MSKRQKVGIGTSNPDLEGPNVQAGVNTQGDQTDRVASRPNEQRSGTPTITVRVPRWLCYGGVVASVLVAVTAVLVVLVTPSRPDVSEWMLEVQDRVGKEGVAVFTAYDLNRDGYLSVLEFEPLIPHLENLTLVTVMPKDEFFQYTPTEGEEVLVLQAAFQPLQLETMTKEDILDLNFGASNPLHGLKNWTSPHMSTTMFGVKEFKIFLPSDVENVALGKPYHVVDQKSSGVLFNSPQHLPSSRFYPPAPTEKDSVLYRLLGMMHPRPFIEMRFPPRGIIACVRAYTSQYLHIVFRMHAEFQLNEPPTNPFWFTPAQFVGDLVISRDGSHIAYFHMQVPNDKRLNVDMEWLTGSTSDNDNGMEVDIGYMPQMEWTAGSISHLPSADESEEENTSTEHQASYRTPAAAMQPEDIQWDSLISQEDALRSVEIEFYPFKVVTYHNLTKAHQLSQEQNKPMHGVFLWGALDDQSC